MENFLETAWPGNCPFVGLNFLYLWVERVGLHGLLEALSALTLNISFILSTQLLFMEK